MFVKGMFLPVEVGVGIKIDEWHPLRAALIESVRQFHESFGLELVLRIHLFYF